MNPIWQYFVAENQRYQSLGMMQNPAADRLILVMGLMLLAAGAAVFFTAGYHAGFHTINGMAHHFPPAFLQNLTFVGDTLTVLVLLFILSRGDHRLYWLIFVTAIIGTAITHGLKESVQADRPPGVLEAGSFFLTGPKVTRVSFPSGHTLTAFCLAGVMQYHYRSWALRVFFIVLAVGAGVSRTLVGVHWPVDELVGAGAGLVSVWLAIRVCRKFPVGLGLRWQVFLNIVMFGCALAMFNYDGHYAMARPFALVLAVIGVVVAVYRYVYQPMRLAR